MIISINSTVHTVKIQAGTLLLTNIVYTYRYAWSTVFFLLSTYEVCEVNDLCMSASSPPPPRDLWTPSHINACPLK